jgi:hypothetical protein
MNKIRLLALLTGLVLIIIGFAKIILVGFPGPDASVYTSAVLITIGGMLIIAVRRK